MSTCLFFDEMPVIRKIAERILTSVEYETSVAETLDEVSAYLSEHGAPNLMILSMFGGDLKVPDTVKLVRETSKQAIILVSVIDSGIGTLMRFRRAGANGVLMKPFDADDFKERISVHRRAAELAA